MQRKSLIDIADGKDACESVVIKEDQRRSLMGFPSHYKVKSFITERYRLSIYSCADQNELYDLEKIQLSSKIYGMFRIIGSSALT